MKFNNGVMTLTNSEKVEVLKATREFMDKALEFYKGVVDEQVNEEVGLNYWKVNDHCCDLIDECLTVEGNAVWGNLSVSDTLNNDWRKMFDGFWKDLCDYCHETKGICLFN